MKLKFFQHLFRYRLRLISLRRTVFIKAGFASLITVVLLLNMILDIPWNIQDVFASPGHDGGHNEETISGSSSDYPVVTVQKAKPADQLKQNIEASGEVFPYQESEIFALREGIIQSMSVNVGDIVKKGQVLGYLYPDVDQSIYNAELTFAQAEQSAAQKRRDFLKGLPDQQGTETENPLSFAQKNVELAKQISKGTLSQINTELEVLTKNAESAKIQQEAKRAQIDVQISSAQQRLKQAQLAAINGISDLISSTENLLFTQSGCITGQYTCPQNLYRNAVSIRNYNSVYNLEGEVRSFYKDFLAFHEQKEEEQLDDLKKADDLLNRALDIAKDVKILATKASSVGETEEEILELKERVDESTDHLVELSNGIIDASSEMKNAEAEKIRLQVDLDQEIVRLAGEKQKLEQGKDKSLAEQNTFLTERLSFAKEVEQQFLESDLEVAIKTAQLSSIRQKIGAGREIVAPFGGTIARRYVNEGDSVDFEKPVYSIVNNEKRFVRFFVRESDLVFIEKNAEITFSPTSAAALQFAAKIVRIAPSLDRDTRTVLIEADLEPSEKNEKILAHMNVRIQIPVSNDPSLKVLPEKALELSDGESVWVVNEKVEIEKLPVSVRFIHDGYAYIEGDLDKSWVVTKTPVELTEGLAVETSL